MSAVRLNRACTYTILYRYREKVQIEPRGQQKERSRSMQEEKGERYRYIMLARRRSDILRLASMSHYKYIYHPKSSLRIPATTTYTTTYNAECLSLYVYSCQTSTTIYSSSYLIAFYVQRRNARYIDMYHRPIQFPPLLCTHSQTHY